MSFTTPAIPNLEDIDLQKLHLECFNWNLDEQMHTKLGVYIPLQTMIYAAIDNTNKLNPKLVNIGVDANGARVL